MDGAARAQSDPLSIDAPAKKNDVSANIQISERQVDQQDQAKVQQDDVIRKVAEAIPKVREMMQKNQRSLDFEVAEAENRVIITVIDKETEKVIRQIPPEDILQIAEAIEQGIEQGLGGFMLNSRA